MTETRREPYRLSLATPGEAAVAAAAEAVELWGGDWQRGEGASKGEVRLPVKAGLRFGFLAGDLEVVGNGGDCELVLRPRATTYFLNTAAVVILLIAAVGAFLLVAWPFFPQSEKLAQVAPLGALLALGGWFLVLSRLESRGPEEFLDLVSRLAEHGVPDVGAVEEEEPPPPATRPA